MGPATLCLPEEVSAIVEPGHALQLLRLVIHFTLQDLNTEKFNSFEQKRLVTPSKTKGAGSIPSDQVQS